MKAISIKQPYAELILQGKKTIELRTWNTRLRGSFFIHASKKADIVAMKQYGFSDLKTGAILGKANLIEVKKYILKEDYESDKCRHLSTKSVIPYGFIIQEVRRIKPVACKGKLNFWQIPIKIAQQIKI